MKTAASTVLPATALPVGPRGVAARPRALHAKGITPAGRRARTMAAAVEVADSATVLPALREGTPASFPIPADQLIERAKYVLSTDSGVTDESVLADDFRFAFPVIKLDKDTYLKSVRGFQLRTGIPDLKSNAYDFRVDSYEPNRVWFTIRTTGTHTGTFKFGRSAYAPTGSVIQGAPECASYVFNEEGKVKVFTGGYVMDNELGNTGGLGAAFGILHAVGVKVPQPGTLGWTVATSFNRLFTWFENLSGKKQ